jgi:hypothetical protein
VRHRVSTIFAAAVAVFWIAWPLVWRYWADTVTSWGTISTNTPWFDKAFLLLWVLMLALVVVIAVVAAVMSRPRQRTLFGILLGVVCGGTAYVRQTHFFAADAPVASYVWTYGTYAIAILGGIAGVAISRFFGESPPDTSLERTREG